MEIKVKVPDNVRLVKVYSFEEPNRNTKYHKGIQLATKVEIYEKDQLQSKIIRDEPCEWCAIESEIEPSCIACEHIEEINGDGCDYCDDQSKFKPTKHFCGFCGRDLRKDVNK